MGFISHETVYGAVLFSQQMNWLKLITFWI